MMEEMTKPIPGRKLTNEELSMFCLKLSMMIKAGITVENSFDVLLEEAISDDDMVLLSSIHASISDGSSVSKALQHTGRFPNHMIQMIQIGQVTGKTSTVLTSLFEYYRREANLSKIIKNAVMYPAIMLTVTSVILFVLVSQVLPVFERVYRDMGSEVSAAVSVLLAVGNVSKNAAIGLGIIFIVIIISACILGLSRNGKDLMSKLADAVFFGGKLDTTISQSRFSSAMSLMLSSGLNIVESMEQSLGLIKNKRYTSSILLCKDKMVDGLAFPKAAEEAGIFTRLHCSLLSAGFRSGLTSEAMEEVANICENDADSLILTTISRIEPLLIVILALAVGLVLLSVMLPLIGMMSAIGT